MNKQPQRIGRYQIVECVGRGGMGVLYRAHDATLERDVAIKLMLVDFSVDETARERFQREAKAIARLQHRNVVTIHELGEEDNTPFIVMEFLGGRDLEKLMRSQPPLSLDEKLDVVIQLCAGLSFAHERGIVHRDIKPGNVRVLDDGTVKILDFGIAKLAIGGTTQAGMVMGSASYMAPEQAANEPVDGRADLFSTGVLLYELLSGRKPFLGETPTATLYQIVHKEPPPLLSLVPDLPPQLIDVVTRALKKNPDERYSRASEMAADLQIVRAILQTPTVSGVTVSEGAELYPAALSTPLDRAQPTPTGGRLAAAELRPAIAGQPVDVALDKPAAGWSAPAAASTNRRTIVIACAAVTVAAIATAALVLRNTNAGPSPVTDRTAAPSSTTTAPVSDRATPVPSGNVPVPDSLSVDSVPTGARILLDGRDTGKITPASITLDGKQPKMLQLQLKGYQPLVARLDSKDLTGGPKVFMLTKDVGPVRVTVTGSYPFQIVQGSRIVSASKEAHDIVVQPGQAGFRVVSPDVFLNANIDDEIRRGRAVQVPELGTVFVFSTVERDCSVSIDGRNLGDPPVQNQSIAAGTHSFSVRCEDERADAQRVAIAPRERTRVTLSPKD